MTTFQKPPVGMLPQDRLDYSAIPTRKPLNLPNGARMVVWTITNVEEWDPTQTMPRTVLPPPAGGSPMPDIPNWCWHEYGNRVGFWRLLQVYDEFKIPGVININGVGLFLGEYDVSTETVVRHIEYVAELPHTPTGRVAKHRLPRERTPDEWDKECATDG